MLPPFRLRTMLDGSYSSELERFYLDQLPLRDFFIASDQEMTAQLSTIFGLNPVQLVRMPNSGADLGEGENLGLDDKELVTFPKASERPGEGTSAGSEPAASTADSPAATGPTSPQTAGPTATPTIGPTEPEAENPTGTQTESPTEPEVPAETTPIQQSGSILIMGDRAVEIFYSSQQTIDSYIELVNRVHSSANGATLYNLLAPTASEFYAPEGYRGGFSNQNTVISEIYNRLDPGVRPVDVYQTLRVHQDEYIYFRTDHHWTALGAYHAYTVLGREAGFEPLPLSAYDHGTMDGDFLGTLFAWGGNPKSLAENPDHVEYWLPPVTAEGYAFTDETMAAGYPIQLIKTTVSGANLYLAFTEGDHGLARFDTSAGNGRSIMVIKESYGNAIVPFLAPHYEHIYVFDPRKATISMASFVEENGIDDILMINYSIAIGNQGWKDALASSLK